jgi:hypothetical protein
MMTSEGDSMRGKHKMKNAKSVLIASIPATALILMVPAALHAQSCALCYQSAAASGTHFIRALKDGILILLVPPIIISLCIAAMAYRKRNTCREEEGSPIQEHLRSNSAILSE